MPRKMEENPRRPVVENTVEGVIYPWLQLPSFLLYSRLDPSYGCHSYHAAAVAQ